MLVEKKELREFRFVFRDKEEPRSGDRQIKRDPPHQSHRTQRFEKPAARDRIHDDWQTDQDHTHWAFGQKGKRGEHIKKEEIKVLAVLVARAEIKAIERGGNEKTEDR